MLMVDCTMYDNSSSNIEIMIIMSLLMSMSLIMSLHGDYYSNYN